MSQKKRKLYWFYKILSVIVSCAFPIWAIYEKFPLWTTIHGATRSVGAGSILCMIVILIVFRKSVFKFFADKLFRPPIPRSVKISEAPSHGMPITDYDKNGKGAAAYSAVALELMQRCEK